MLSHGMPRVRACALLAFVGVLAGLSGCGSGRGDVRGKVSFKGTPLKGGRVTFASTDGGPSYNADIDTDGTYFASNVGTGPYKVCVDTDFMKPKGGGPKMPMMGGRPGGMPPGIPPGVGGQQDLVKAQKDGKIKSGPPGGLPPEAGGNKMMSGLDYMKIMNDNYVAIPLKYADPATTDLTYTVHSGSNSFDIELQGGK